MPRLNEDMSEEQRKKISKAMAGRKKKRATKLAIAASLKAYWQRRRNGNMSGV